MYKIFLRREQYGAIKCLVLKNLLFTKTAHILAKLTARDIIQAEVQTGEATSVRDVLRKAGIDDDLQRILRVLQVVQRSVQGSDAERSSLRHKFCAMKLWNGMSFIFFTLNPNEWGSPLTLLFRTPYDEKVKKFSLELTDQEFEDIYGQVNKGEKKKQLYMMGLEDPVACVKCLQAF